MFEMLPVVTLLLMLALLFVLWPLLKRANEPEQIAARKQANVATFKVRMAELEREAQLGGYSEKELSTLRIELERGLLDDVKDERIGTVVRFTRPVILLSALLLPLAAFWGYQQLGAADDLKIRQVLAQLQVIETREMLLPAMAAAVEQIEQRLNEVDNPEYSMLVARFNLELQRFDRAAEHYRGLVELSPEDPVLMGRYAQALYLAEGRQFTPEVEQWVERTLALQPFNTTVLGMMGMISFEAGKYQAAADYWRRLLGVLEPESENAKMIANGIAQAELRIQPSGKDTAQSTENARVQVLVSLDSALTAEAEDSVFVFARAVNGPSMPLAVARLTVADLPVEVTLDDSMAMAPGLSLSNFEQVQLVARVSSRGIANPQSGDLEGISPVIALANLDKPVALVISTIRQ
jgi:cytochrome c-type biogenesis protein CcmH